MQRATLALPASPDAPEFCLSILESTSAGKPIEGTGGRAAEFKSNLPVEHCAEILYKPRVHFVKFPTPIFPQSSAKLIARESKQPSAATLENIVVNEVRLLR